MKLMSAIAFCITLSIAGAAGAQMPACAGHFEVIRTDTILPGKLDLFLKATRDQQAWYEAKSLPDHILVGRVLQPRGLGAAYSDTVAMTIHTDARSPGAPPHEGDAAWDAFVAEYKASSETTNQTVICATAAQ